MASITKRLRSPFWWASYYREDGGRAQTSKKTTDKKTAMRIATELEEAHRNRVTEAQMRRILSNLNERLTGQPLASSSLQDYASQWLQRKKGEVEHVTALAYKGTIEEFVKSTPAKAGMGIQYVTTADIAAYRDKSAAKASPATANNKLKILRAMFQTAWRDGFISENCAAKVEILATEDSLRRPFKLTEVNKVLAIANEEWRGMVLVGLYTGQRLKDIASLKWNNVDLSNRLITLTTSKTNRLQEIPIAAPLVKYFEGLDTPDDARTPIFPVALATVAHDGNVSRLSQQFYELLVTAGLASERLAKNETKGVGRTGKRLRSELSFHCLRHTATSLLKNAGVSEAIAMDIIGHDTKAVSAHYAHIDVDAKRTAMDKLPDLMAKKGGEK